MPDRVTEYRALTSARDAMLTAFTDARSRRDRHHGYVAGPDGRIQPAWVAYERQQMLTAVNRLRAVSGLPPAAELAVWSVELQACGSADYASKYALYCAEIVTGARFAETGRYGQ
jgi:hypothetical protein